MTRRTRIAAIVMVAGIVSAVVAAQTTYLELHAGASPMAGRIADDDLRLATMIASSERRAILAELRRIADALNAGPPR